MAIMSNGSFFQLLRVTTRKQSLCQHREILDYQENMLRPHNAPSHRREKKARPYEWTVGLNWFDIAFILDLSLEDSGNYTCLIRGTKSTILGSVTHYIFIRGKHFVKNEGVAPLIAKNLWISSSVPLLRVSNLLDAVMASGLGYGGCASKRRSIHQISYKEDLFHLRATC